MITLGFEIDEIYIINGVSVDPAVVVSTGSYRVDVRTLRNTLITTLVERDDGASWPVYVAPELIVKTADEVVNNSTTLQNDDHMFFPIDANERVAFLLHLTHVGGSTADLKVNFAGPSGVNIR